MIPIDPLTAGRANLPIPRSQPTWLATMSQIRGLKPADPDAARVIEIGCGTGRNLIPMAERHPQSTFVGIASVPEHATAADEVAESVGLQNIEFRAQDLRELDADLGAFDYIIAERVYSWVSASRRDKLLEFCRDHLAPQGVAYVGYSTYPGCRIHDVLIAMMRYNAAGAASVPESVVRARELLEFLKRTLKFENPFHALLQRELAVVGELDDYNLVSGYLAGTLQPIYFLPFLAHATQHGLQYLGDCAVGIRYTDRLDDAIELELGKVAADPMRQEQYRDIIRNRRFRQTLLCHAGLQIDTALSARHLQGMYLEAPLVPDESGARIFSTMMDRFAARGGLSVSTTAPLIKAALVHLGEAWPEYVAVEDLVAAACGRLEQVSKGILITDADRARLRDNLVECCAGGVLVLHDRPAPFVALVHERPQAAPFARWQAEHAEPPINRRHESVSLEPGDVHVLGLLDGTRGAEDLLQALVVAAEQGYLGVLDQNQAVDDPERLRQLLAAELIESLARLSKHALLVG